MDIWYAFFKAGIWPGTVIFMLLFLRKEIRFFLGRIIELSFGGVKAKLQPAEEKGTSEIIAELEEVKAEAKEVGLSGSIEATSNVEGKLTVTKVKPIAPPNEFYAPKQLAVAELLIRKLEENVDYWRIKYLNSFLIPKTKNVLRYVNEAGPLNLVELGDSWFRQQHVGVETIRPLLENKLLVVDEEIISLTDFGEKFLKEIGKGYEPEGISFPQKTLSDILNEQARENALAKEKLDSLGGREVKSPAEELAETFSDDLRQVPKPPKER